MFEPVTGMIHVLDLQDCEKVETPAKIFCIQLVPKDKSKKTYPARIKSVVFYDPEATN